jgi:hypothetical protein
VVASKSTARRWRPFWVHQGAEYVLGLVLVAAGVQSPTPTFPVVAGGLIVLNAAIVDGPLGAFRLATRPAHRILDVGVILIVAAIAAMPFLSIDAASRVTMIVVAAFMGFLWASTNFETRRAAIDRRTANRLATAGERSEAIGRTAGRLVAKAGQYARKRREQ